MDPTNSPSKQSVPDLSAYTAGFSRGRPAVVEAIWILVQWLFVSSWIPGSAHRRFLLKLFGATIGAGAVIKPRVRVKFPWRLTLGSHAWIGEGVWIDNLACVTIESNAVLSQGVYLCTGSHDWTSPGFDLITKPITVKSGAWAAAYSVIGPGVQIGEGAVLGLGSTASSNLDPWMVYTGVPAAPVKPRIVHSEK